MDVTTLLQIELGQVIAWGQALLAAGIGIALAQLRAVLKQARETNRRLTRVESWQAGHERQDMERFKNVQRQLDRVDRRCESVLQRSLGEHP